MRRLIHPIKYNSLSIVLFVLFVICMLAQSFAGWRLQNEILAAHGLVPIDYWHNLSTGAFLEGLASNWQAAFLQLASLIAFSGFLYQRGAPHSRDPLKAKNSENCAKKLAASPGSTAIRFFWRFCCSLSFHSRCMSFSARRPTTRTAHLPASRRSPSLHFCFRLNSGPQPCKRGRRNIWRSCSLSYSVSSCASRDRRNSKPIASRSQTTGAVNK